MAAATSQDFLKLPGGPTSDYSWSIAPFGGSPEKSIMPFLASGGWSPMSTQQGMFAPKEAEQAYVNTYGPNNKESSGGFGNLAMPLLGILASMYLGPEAMSAFSGAETAGAAATGESAGLFGGAGEIFSNAAPYFTGALEAFAPGSMGISGAFPGLADAMGGGFMGGGAGLLGSAASGEGGGGGFMDLLRKILPGKQGGSFPLFDIAKGAYGLNQSRGMSKLARPGIEAGKQLTALEQNPNLIMQTPGYQFGMDAGRQALERSLAGQGYTGSGNALIELNNFGQQYAGQQLASEKARLGNLASGALPANIASNVMQGNALNSLLYGGGRLLQNYLS